MRVKVGGGARDCPLAFFSKLPARLNMTLTFRIPAVYPIQTLDFSREFCGVGGGVGDKKTKKSLILFLEWIGAPKEEKNRKPVLWFSEISLRETRFEFAV